MADAGVPELSAEGRFLLGYDAALAWATIAVLASGHRVKSRLGHHQITFAAAGNAVGERASILVNYLDNARRTRNEISYEGDEIGNEQAYELVREAGAFATLVDTWLREHHPRFR